MKPSIFANRAVWMKVIRIPYLNVSRAWTLSLWYSSLPIHSKMADLSIKTFEIWEKFVNTPIGDLSGDSRRRRSGIGAASEEDPYGRAGAHIWSDWEWSSNNFFMILDNLKWNFRPAGQQSGLCTPQFRKSPPSSSHSRNFWTDPVDTVLQSWACLSQVYPFLHGFIK